MPMEAVKIFVNEWYSVIIVSLVVLFGSASLVVKLVINRKLNEFFTKMKDTTRMMENIDVSTAVTKSNVSAIRSGVGRIEQLVKPGKKKGTT